MPSIHLDELCKVLEKEGLSPRIDGGPADRSVSAVNTLERASEDDITFLANPKYSNRVKSTRAGAIITQEGGPGHDTATMIRCKDPYAAITVAIIAIHGYRKHPAWGVSDRAEIDPTATLGKNANIAAGATIASRARIGNRCTIYPGCYVGDEAQIGDDCVLFPNVVIYDRCELGHRVTIHSGTVIGEDGLGYAPKGEEWFKIPQAGTVLIGDDVEIGANSAIDRATLGATEIASGTKFGNVVVIGHGSTIGPNCLFVGLIGMAGSVTVGRHVTLAGQVGMAGHISIADNTRVGGQSGIHTDTKPGEEIFGSPALPIDRARRCAIAYQKLPEWTKRVKELERQLAELHQNMATEPDTRG